MQQTSILYRFSCSLFWQAKTHYNNEAIITDLKGSLLSHLVWKVCQGERLYKRHSNRWISDKKKKTERFISQKALQCALACRYCNRKQCNCPQQPILQMSFFFFWDRINVSFSYSSERGTILLFVLNKYLFTIFYLCQFSFTEPVRSTRWCHLLQQWQFMSEFLTLQ